MSVKNAMIEQRRGGFYWLEGKPYLSVTTILKVIDKPALMYWFGREVYYGMLQDPSMDERSALAMPYKTSDKAKSRGTTVHSIVEAFKSTEKRIENIPIDFRDYAMAFYDFMGDHNIQILESEKSMVDKEHKIAGTLDMYAKIGGKHMVVDVKTGKDIYMESGLQMSAYAHMKRKEAPVDEIATLLLETGKDGKPTGKYKFQTMPDDFEAFLACKRVYEYVNQEKLLKVGY
jgi:hypothetical protein